MSLIFYLVKRMLAKAFGVDAFNPQNGRKTAPKQPSQPYSNYQQTANQNALDVVETMWVGMSAQQLMSAFGSPSTKQIVAGGEIWTYANLNGNGTQTAVTIQNGLVSSWQNKQTNSPASFAAPAP